MVIKYCLIMEWAKPLVVRVEVLYSPTCANHLMWLDRVRKLVEDLDEGVVLEEIDVWEHPEALKRFWSDVWQEFKEGHIHYFTLVAVNGKAINWYWDLGKVKEAILRELESAP